MSKTAEILIPPKTTPEMLNLHRRLKLGCFTLEGLNALATGYYFNYLSFYLLKHFDFGDKRNLLVAALYGFSYMFAAAYGGRFGKSHGYFTSLRVGFIGMGIFMAFGGIAPLVIGYSHVMMLLEWVIVVGWTITMCFTWPAMQAILSHAQTPNELPHTAGIYNMVWAGGSALAYLTSGALFDRFGGEILFWIPAGIHVLQLILLPGLAKLDAAMPSPQPATTGEKLSELNPRPIARAKTFVKLAWIANPFAYMAIYTVIPIIPNLAKHFNLSPTYAGFVCSMWFWVRVAAFAALWLWPGWHYRFRWLLGAFVALIASFLAIPLSANLLMLLGAQVVFGLAVGLIYYSSLFYSMDVGESRGNRGGFHEAAIGLGIFVGPAAGVGALQAFPGNSNAGTWAISGLLVIGLGLFLWIQLRGQK